MKSNENRFTTLGDEWKCTDGRYQSPDQDRKGEQLLIFENSFKNGSVEAEINSIRSLGTRWDRQPAIEATFVLRYNGQGRYYYAGIGAWGMKYFIAKALPGDIWFHLASSGDVATVNEESRLRIKVECVGNRITLFENGVKLLEVLDEDYETGQCGFRTYKTSSVFSNFRLEVSRPQCFVVMPFASELGFVYEVIRQVVEEHFQITCVRGDELAVSRPIIDDIRSQISEADLVIVDFTNKNPNVYFEAGLADAWKKKWIILAQSPDDLSFDVRHIRSIIYSNTMGADIKLKKNLFDAIRETTGLSPVRELGKN